MRRLAVWAMLLSLILIQGHSFVPHHHHRSAEQLGGIVRHHHAAERPTSKAVGEAHPELAHHVDQHVLSASRAQSNAWGIAIAVVHCPITFSPRVAQTACNCPLFVDLPWSTRSSGSISARAPPPSLNS